MLSQAIWWVSNLLLGLVLCRAFAGGTNKKYPIFYSYIGAVLLRTLISFYLLIYAPHLRGAFYWHTEVILDVLAYFVIFEIYNVVLKEFPGVHRLSQAIIGFFFALASSRLLYRVFDDPSWGVPHSSAALASDLRAMQAAFLLVILVLIVYYTIPLGSNLKGILLGYGLYAGVSVMDLAVRLMAGVEFQAWWVYVDPTAYLIALVIWSVMLWEYSPSPAFETPPGPQRDYEAISGKTAWALSRALSHLGLSVRS